MAHQDPWLMPSILVSLGSILVACGGAFAVVKYQVGDLKTAMADLRREVVSRAEYETQIQALNSQMAQVLQSINRLTDRFERYLDSQR